jgi:hypothetical protein
VNISFLHQTKAIRDVCAMVKRLIDAMPRRPDSVTLSSEQFRKLAEAAKTDDLEFHGVKLVRRA